MSAPTGQTGALLARLDEGLTAVEAALAAELDAIRNGHAPGGSDALLRAVEQKRQALRALETLAADPHLVALLTALPSQPALAGLFERLRACHAQNRVAGSAIATARRSNEQLLQVLGRAPDRPAYNAAGHAPTRSGGRALGVA